MKHELLLELLSKPLFDENSLAKLQLNDKFSDEVLRFRQFLRFNEQEILIRPFVETRRYLTYKEIEEVSEIYFSKYGLFREKYTKKVKLYGLELFRFLTRNRKPIWLLDIAKYEYLLFSQLWLYECHDGERTGFQYSQGEYKLSTSCKLGKFYFDIESYMEVSLKNDSFLKQADDTYLVFIGNSHSLSVQIKRLEISSYNLLKFCRKPRTKSQLISFIELTFSCCQQDISDISHRLIDLFTSWNILEESY